MRPVLLLVAAANPAAVAVALWRRERVREAVSATVVAAAVVVVLAGLSGPLLDALDVTAPSFQVATALVVGLAAAKVLVVGAPRVDAEGPPAGWGRVLHPLLFPVLLTPQLAFAATSVASTEGVALAAAGSIVALAISAAGGIVAKRRALVWAAAMRFVAAVSLALALALAVDGVTTI